jgi:hypothetical protein
VLDIRGERVLVWTRFRAGSPLRSFHRDASAGVVRATSRDGLHWSEPVPCTPADPGDRYVEILPFAFTDSAQDRVYVSWTSNRPHESGDILIHELAPARPSASHQSKRSDYDAAIVPTAGDETDGRPYARRRRHLVSLSALIAAQDRLRSSTPMRVSPSR